MKLYGHLLVAASVGLLLSVTATNPAAAAPPTPLERGCAGEQGDDGPVNAINADELTQRTKALVEDGAIALKATNAADLHWGDANAYEWPAGSFIGIPATKFNGDASSLAVFYDHDGERTDTVETFVDQRDGRLWVQVWRDGERTLNAAVDVENMPAWWGEFEDCLNQHGNVSASTAATLGAICAASCMGTLGTGCVICLGAAGGIGATALGYCAGKVMND